MQTPSREREQVHVDKQEIGEWENLNRSLYVILKMLNNTNNNNNNFFQLEPLQFIFQFYYFCRDNNHFSAQ